MLIATHPRLWDCLIGNLGVQEARLQVDRALAGLRGSKDASWGMPETNGGLQGGWGAHIALLPLPAHTRHVSLGKRSAQLFTARINSSSTIPKLVISSAQRPVQPPHNTSETLGRT